jgi:ABC-type transporter Mla MlaB component
VSFGRLASLIRVEAEGGTVAAPEILPEAAHALRPPPGPKTVVVVVKGVMPRTAVLGLCERVRRLLAAGGADLVTCDVAELAHPDATSIDALARLQLTARRLGRSIRLRNAPGMLRDLLDVTGLCDELPLTGGLPLES